ncbi:hypothetical protein ALT716_120121 [Alteromonas macleodii]
MSSTSLNEFADGTGGAGGAGGTVATNPSTSVSISRTQLPLWPLTEKVNTAPCRAR